MRRKEMKFSITSKQNNRGALLETTEIETLTCHSKARKSLAGAGIQIGT